jgi:hypothetical protein
MHLSGLGDNVQNPGAETIGAIEKHELNWAATQPPVLLIVRASRSRSCAEKKHVQEGMQKCAKRARNSNENCHKKCHIPENACQELSVSC